MSEYNVTGWQASSIAVLDSKDSYPDSVIVEVRFKSALSPLARAHTAACAQGIWLQAAGCAEGASPYDTTNSRSQVAIGQIQELPSECVHAAPEVAREMLYRNKNCTHGRVPADEYQTQKPVEFQARCMVVLIEESSRRALLNSLVAAGRALDHPLQVSMNFTTVFAQTPDFAVSSMSCAIGEIILENYARDSVGQQLQLELDALKSKLSTKQAQTALFEKTVRGLSAYRSPNAPPPPKPPPRPHAPPGELAPPTPPEVVTFDVRLQQMRAEESALATAVSAKLAEMGGPCVSSSTNTCGRTATAAPNPWIAADGTHCAGYATQEAVEGSFCAHWGSPVRASCQPHLPASHTCLQHTLTAHLQLTEQR